MTAAIRQPARMIFSRPILSDSQPKKMKNGVPIRSEMRDQRVGRDVVELERDGEEEQRVELARVPDHALAGGGAEQREQHVLVVRIVEEALGQRRLRALALCLHLLEDRRLVQLEPDVDREHQQDERDQERNAPAPFGEHLGVHVDAAEPDHEQREEEARASPWSE